MSLTGAYDDDNIFAKILRGEMPCVKVFEDDVALAFMDIFPQSRGHTLVIPKGVRARNFLDLPPETVGPYLARVQRVAQAVTTALSPDGVVVLQFNGAPAGQTVFHLHFHVIPRWEGEAMKGHGAAPKADVAELQALAARIAAAL
ncbi:MAG: HIT family protein [Alphaproteobacteria bacterium]|nr:HIT family protein [Alphaproteobacteria bacterium]